MGKCLFCYPNRADGGTLSGGDWLAALPLTNLQDRRIAKVARSVTDAKADTQFANDLGASYPIRLIALPAHNLSLAAQVRVRGYDTLAVTRASSASFKDEDDVIQFANSNILRQWHYITANDSVRYRTTLLEAARTNYAGDSETGSNWVKTQPGWTVTDSNSVAPDGFTTAVLVQSDGVSGNVYTLTPSITVTATKQYTVSGFIKAGSAPWVFVGESGDAVWHRVWINTATWVIGTLSSVDDATIKLWGNGWYRWTVTFTRTNGAGTIRPTISPADSDGAITSTSGETISVWGLGAEGPDAPFASSYISTQSYNLNNAGYLDLPGASGDYASAPDSAALSVTGDIDIRVRVAMDDWTPAAISNLLTKYRSADDNRSYFLKVAAGGTLSLVWTTDGTAGTLLNADSTVIAGVTDGEIEWVRVTMDVNDGGGNRVIKFYKGGSGATPTWVQLGTTVTTAGTTSIFDGTALLELGTFNTGVNDPLAGKIYRAQVYSGIGGTLVFDADFSDITTHNANRLSVTENANSAVVTVFSNSAATTRVKDVFNKAHTAVPQEMTILATFVVGGVPAVGALGVLSVGSGSGNNAEIDARLGTNGIITCFYSDGSSAVSTGAGSMSALVANDHVAFLINVSAAGLVSTSQSVNGGAAQSGSDSAAQTFPAAWANQQVDLNSIDGGSNDGFFSFVSVKIESGTKTLAEMQAEEDPDLFHFGAYDSEWIDAYPTFYPAGSTLWGKDVGSQTLSTEEFTTDGRRLDFIHVTTKAQPFQIWSLECDDTANVDTYVEAGRLFIASAYSPTINFAGGGNIGYETGSTRTRTRGGSTYHDVQPKNRIQNITIPDIQEDEAFVQLFEMDRVLGTDQQFFWVYDQADTVHMQRRAFLATLRELDPLQIPSHDFHSKPFSIVEEL